MRPTWNRFQRLITNWSIAIHGKRPFLHGTHASKVLAVIAWIQLGLIYIEPVCEEFDINDNPIRYRTQAHDIEIETVVGRSQGDIKEGGANFAVV